MPTIFTTSSGPGLADLVQSELPGWSIAQLPSKIGDAVCSTGEDNWFFIDWLLDDRSGLELCRHLRSLPATAASHITMILDRPDRLAQSRALAAGCDDYVEGPLSPDLLIDRMKGYLAQRRRTDVSRPLADLTIDMQAHQVRWQGHLVPLCPREMQLLSAFMKNPDKILTRSDLIELIGADGSIFDARTADVWVGRLRRTLNSSGVPPFVRTVRSRGYIFDTPR